ncbi:DUF2695 domain-containing protein [Hymenobacter sp. HMF4947]|uniref:DUF2695 domain-containing protein n=1 Tax=Hymenobacter ginkgonis TaxID=2682976 RepID=A0A7K1TIG1_9BACT|nr:DUF2695 domain-containing protein [Hymenobacter ginkgonis]MVN78200.1 DUF2695 domain-containing protein [Hymenobacter ginkgonis]
MPSAEEKKRRKQAMQQLQVAATNSLLAGLPMDLGQLKGLFDYLDAALSKTECDDTLRLTKQFAAEVDLPFEPLQKWLSDQGGYCDCEVLANVEEKVEDLL